MRRKKLYMEEQQRGKGILPKQKLKGKKKKGSNSKEPSMSLKIHKGHPIINANLQKARGQKSNHFPKKCGKKLPFYPKAT